MIIDAHTHIFSDGLCRNRESRLDDPNFGLLYRNPSRLAICRNLLDHMDTFSIRHSLCLGFAWHREKYCEAENDYLARAQSEFPDRISAFGSVPVDAGVRCGEWVSRISELGLKGIGEVAFYSEGFTPKHRDYLEALLEAASRHRLPVNLHVNEPLGHCYPGKYDPGLDALCCVLKKFPGLTVVLSHWGGGLVFYELMPDVAESLGHCLYDTAATPYLYDPRIYGIAAQIAGSRRILLGTDYPLLKFDKYLDALSSQIDGEQARNDIMGGNAARLLGLEAEGRG